MNNTRYRGNELIPRAGAPKEYTKEQVEEIIKCAEDVVYYAKTYFKIVHVDKGLIPFNVYDYQEEAMRAMQERRHVLLCWSRQSGKTTAVIPAILHYATFNEEKTIAILANRAQTARQILDRIKKAYENLPDWLKPGVVEWNKSKVVFENGSIIMADSTNSDTVRGYSLSMIYLDEVAFVRNWNEFSASVMPTISSGKETKIIMTSTPNGMNHFYYFVEGAREGTNGYWLSEIPWYKVPGRDEKWKQKTLAELNHDKIQFACEYELEFSGSSDTLISPIVLKTMKPQEPISSLMNHTLRIYEAPKEEHIYVMTVDVSRGKGLDYSAFIIFDVTGDEYKQVVAFTDNLILPVDFANLIKSMAERYNEAYVLVEINDLGQQVSDVLFDMEYENLIYTENRGRNGKQVSGGFGRNVDRGIRTTLPVRNIGCMNTKLLIEEKKLIIVDMDTIQELITFVKKGQKYQAEEGKHDDLAMCIVLFGWLTGQTYFKNITDNDIMAKIREISEEEMENMLPPFGFIDDRIDDAIIYDDNENW